MFVWGPAYINSTDHTLYDLAKLYFNIFEWNGNAEYCFHAATGFCTEEVLTTSSSLVENEKEE